MQRRWIIVVLVVMGLVPVGISPAFDFNGDGSDDIAVFRPSTGLWAVRGVTRSYFGGFNDEPAVGDYDGDGADEIAIYRATTGLWAIRGGTRIYYGSAGDLPIGGSDGDWYRSGDNLCAMAEGNIGIGTGTPQEKLHLYEQNFIPNIRLERGLGGETWDIGGSTGVFLNFAYNGSKKVSFSTSGSVGIGTDTPDANLTVQGSSGEVALVKVNQIGVDNYGGLRVDRDGTEKWFVGLGDSNDDFLIRRSAGTNDLIVSSSTGNVGIGTTPWGSPRLIVAGQILMQDYSSFSYGAGYSGILSSSGELYAIDQGGNLTQLSPHDPATGEWIFYSKNVKTGRVVQVDMERLVKKVEELTGERFLVESWEKPGPGNVESDPDNTR